ADRLRSFGGTRYNGASARADLVSPIGTLSGFVEHDGFRRVTSADVGLRAEPLPFIAVSGSLSRSAPTGTGSSGVAATSMRGEAAIKLFGPWVSVGLISTDNQSALAPLAYDTLLLASGLGRVSA